MTRGSLPRVVRDTDVSQVQEWLQHQGMPTVGMETVHQAVDQRAQECAYHPVRDYLDKLKWDGVSRLDHWLVSYVGANLRPTSHSLDACSLLRWSRASRGQDVRLTTCSCLRVGKALGSREPAACWQVNGFRMICRTYTQRMRGSTCGGSGS